MGDHPWVLTDLLAALMLCVAVYCTGRLALSFGSRRATQRDTDVIHTVMGVSMAGMLAPSLAAGPTGLWVMVFAASTLWFGWKVVGDSDREVDGVHALGGHLPHLLMSVAMVYVLIVAEWTGSMSTSHGATLLEMGAASTSVSRWPLPTVLLAVLLLGDGVLTFSRNLRRLTPQITEGNLAMARADEPVFGSAGPQAESSVRLDVRRSSARTSTVLAPRSFMVCQLVMSLVMGYMLVSLL